MKNDSANTFSVFTDTLDNEECASFDKFADLGYACFNMTLAMIIMLLLLHLGTQKLLNIKKLHYSIMFQIKYKILLLPAQKIYWRYEKILTQLYVEVKGL